MDLNSVNITATQVAKNYFSAYVENGFIYSYSVYGEHFDEDLAKQAVSEMINAGGTTGEKWSKERTDEAARIVGITENLWDFYYVINMYYSDYNTVIGEDITMAAKLSKAFIEDVDVPEGKAYRYYKYVVKDE